MSDHEPRSRKFGEISEKETTSLIKDLKENFKWVLYQLGEGLDDETRNSFYSLIDDADNFLESIEE